MKSFIMLDLPDDTKDTLVNLQSRFNIDKVSHDKLHLTMRFIGEVTFHQDEKIRQEFNRLTFPQMVFEIDHLGVFYNQNIVIWAGLSGNLNPLFQLNRDIENLVSNIIGPSALPFKPHITLGRADQPIDLSAIELSSILFAPRVMAYVHSKRVNDQTVYQPVEKVVCGG
jgi:2'-5' RNA ligase